MAGAPAGRTSRSSCCAAAAPVCAASSLVTPLRSPSTAASIALRALILALQLANDCSIASLFYRILVRSNGDTVLFYRRGTTFLLTSNRCLISGPAAVNVNPGARAAIAATERHASADVPVRARGDAAARRRWPGRPQTARQDERQGPGRSAGAAGPTHNSSPCGQAHQMPGRSEAGAGPMTRQPAGTGRP